MQRDRLHFKKAQEKLKNLQNEKNNKNNALKGLEKQLQKQKKIVAADTEYVLMSDLKKMKEKWHNLNSEIDGLKIALETVFQNTHTLYTSIIELSQWNMCLKDLVPLLNQINNNRKRVNKSINKIPNILYLNLKSVSEAKETYKELKELQNTIRNIIRRNQNEFKNEVFVTISIYFIKKLELSDERSQLLLKNNAKQSRYNECNKIKVKRCLSKNIVIHIARLIFKKCLTIEDKNLERVFQKNLKINNPKLQLIGGGKSGAKVYIVDGKNNKKFVFKTYSEKILYKGKREISIACHLGYGENKIKGSPKVYDFGRIKKCGKSLLFLLLEKVDGKELNKIDIVKLEYHDLLAVMFKILYFLYSATKKISGFRHNDLHPGNIFINTDVKEEETVYNIEGMEFKVGGPKVTVIDFDLSSSDKLHENYAVRHGKPNFWLPSAVYNLLLKSVGYGNILEIINKCRVYSEDLTIWNIYFLTMKIIETCKNGTKTDNGVKKYCYHSEIDKIIDSYKPCISVYDCFSNNHFKTFRQNDSKYSKRVRNNIDLVRKWSSVSLSEYIKENQVTDIVLYCMKQIKSNMNEQSSQKFVSFLRDFRNGIKDFHDKYLNKNKKFPHKEDIKYKLHLNLEDDFTPCLGNLMLNNYLEKKDLKINFPRRLSLFYENNAINIDLNEGVSVEITKKEIIKILVSLGLEIVAWWYSCFGWFNRILHKISKEILDKILKKFNKATKIIDYFGEESGNILNSLGNVKLIEALRIKFNIKTSMVRMHFELNPNLTDIFEKLVTVILTVLFGVFPGMSWVQSGLKKIGIHIQTSIGMFLIAMMNRFGGYSLDLDKFDKKSAKEKATFILNKILDVTTNRSSKLENKTFRIYSYRRI